MNKTWSHVLRTGPRGNFLSPYLTVPNSVVCSKCVPEKKKGKQGNP